MECSKKLRVRSTINNAPDYHWTETSIITSTRGEAYAHYAKSIVESTFSKSIVDGHCQVTLKDGETCPPAACKKACKDCVKQSKLSFNAVRAEKHYYRANAQHGITLQAFAPFVGNTDIKWKGVNMTKAGSDPLDRIRSEINLPSRVPSAVALSNALREITPSVDKFFPTVNIYETVVELRELKNLLKLFKAERTRVDIGNRYLGFHFGYLPLIMVIEKILKILISLDNVIDRWNDFATADRIMDFHGTIASDEESGSFDGTLIKKVRTHYHEEIKYNVTQVSKVHLYITPHIIPGDMRYRVLLKSLGIDKPLAGLWELIPFSWLIDYFVNVDDMIDRWETGLNSMFRFEVASLGYSMRQSITGESRVNTLPVNGATHLSPWSELEYTFFERVPLPKSALRDAIIPTEWGWADGPTGMQWTYVLAVGDSLRRGR